MAAHGTIGPEHLGSLAVPSDEHGLSDTCGSRRAVLFSGNRFPFQPPPGDRQRVL